LALYLLGLSLLLAILDWVFIFIGKQRYGKFTKPATLVVLLLWVLINFWNLQDDQSGNLLIWFAVGALFSLVGDVFLMLSERRFPLGLFAFLITHIAYTVGFLYPFPWFNIPRAVIVLLVVLTSLQIMRRINVALIRSSERYYRVSAIAYSVSITIMLISAMWTLTSGDNNWIWPHAWLVSAGGFLFYLSDTLWGWNRHVSTFPNAQLIIRITYHLGQMGILSGAILHSYFLAS
jgi:uncharacterized membrane protein YhhN